jgi:hypothetical protein
MARADHSTNAIKETPQTVDSEREAQVDQYQPQQDDIRGSQAGDKFDNSKPGQIDGGDTDRHGIKPPDAMGAGG